MSNKQAALTVVVLTDKGCARVNHAEPGLTFLVERFTAATKEGQRVAHVRDYRFRDESKAYAIWSLSPDQYQIVCETEEDAAIYYGPAIGKPLPETQATKPEHLPTSGRQGTTATPSNHFAICAGWDFERIDNKRRLLRSCGLSQDFATSGWCDIPENVRSQLLGVPPSKTCTQTWSAAGGRVERQCTEPANKENICAECGTARCDEHKDISFEEINGRILCEDCQPNSEQIISDRTAQHYTDPARD